MPHRSPPSAPVDPAAADWHDLQEHQYVPGHYTGNRLPPHVWQPRPGKIGYLFLALGGISTLMLLVALVVSAYAIGNVTFGVFLGPGLLALLLIASGYSLLRKR